MKQLRFITFADQILAAKRKSPMPTPPHWVTGANERIGDIMRLPDKIGGNKFEENGNS